MKILHVLNELKFSGAEIMYVDAAPSFQNLGAELYVLNTSENLGEYAPYFEKAGYKVLHWWIQSGLYNNWHIRREILTFLYDNKFEVVHVHRSDLAWIFAYCCHVANITCVYTYHSVFSSNWYSYHLHCIKRWMQRTLWKQKQTTISDSVYNNEKDHYKNPTYKIYNWWSSNRFYPAIDTEKERTRMELNIPKDSLVLISVGRCTKLKRHHDIIKALPLIKTEFPNLIYLHLGQGDTLSEEMDLAKKLDVYNNIRFLGNQNDVRKFLISSDIYVMTSTHEGISLTTIEAMACHIPCVLYNVPGLMDFNSEVETSVSITEDFEILAQSIINLYKDKNKQMFLINNAHQYIYDRFCMENNAKKIFELYTS